MSGSAAPSSPFARAPIAQLRFARFSTGATRQPKKTEIPTKSSLDCKSLIDQPLDSGCGLNSFALPVKDASKGLSGLIRSRAAAPLSRENGRLTQRMFA